MRVLITGGAGFIGSHLADLLLSRDQQVVAIDDLSTGSVDNIAHLRERDDFQLHIGSVTDAPLLTEVMAGCDLVFHLAAAVGVKLIIDTPVEAMMTNINGTDSVLRAAARTRTPLLLASTSEVYGRRTNPPFRETDEILLGPPQSPRWAYACSKIADEFLAMAYRKEQGLPVTVVRLFNTVGPRQTGRYGMVVPRLVRQALAGEPLTIFGDGKQTRCFADVRQVVRILAQLIDEPEARARIINVGSENEVSILALAELVKSLVGSSSEIQLIPYEQAYGEDFEDMQRRVPDLTRLRALANEVPDGKLEPIIEAVVVHEQQHGGRPAVAW